MCLEKIDCSKPWNESFLQQNLIHVCNLIKDSESGAHITGGEFSSIHPRQTIQNTPEKVRKIIARCASFGLAIHVLKPEEGGGVLVARDAMAMIRAMREAVYA